MTETETGHLGFSLMDPAVQSCPWPFYQQLHEQAPVYRMPETGFYVITRWEDCRRVLGDTETFSSQANITEGPPGRPGGAAQPAPRRAGLEPPCDAPPHRPAGAHPLPQDDQPRLQPPAGPRPRARTSRPSPTS